VTHHGNDSAGNTSEASYWQQAFRRRTVGHARYHGNITAISSLRWSQYFDDITAISRRQNIPIQTEHYK
jgi:hypothetical protein